MENMNSMKKMSFNKNLKKDDLKIIILKFFFLFLAAIVEITIVSFLVKMKFYIPLGPVIIILIQSFYLSKRYSKAFSALEASSKELELQFIERSRELENADRQKTNYFIDLAHEIKTPLTLISNYLEQYTRKVKMNDELHLIKRNIDTLNRDMITFLDVEKIKQGRIDYNHNTILDVSTLISETKEIFKGIVFHRDIQILSHIEANIFIKADPSAFGTVLNNLLSNALKYTDNKGEVKITLKSDEKKVILTVEDTGIGIPEDKLEEIFLPYYQVSDGKSHMHGIGMGLYIVNKIIKSLNGKITVASKQGEGTKFTVILNRYALLGEGEKKEGVSRPITPSSGRNIITPHNGNNGNNRKQQSSTDTHKLKDSCYCKGKNTIFIIEDNGELLSFLIDKLSVSYNVYYANDGYEALNKLNRIPRPDIIISDIMMKKMDGFQMLTNIQENMIYNDIPFIFLTAKTSEKDKIDGLRKGAIDYIYKPFSIDELKAKIETIFYITNKMKKTGMNKILEDIEESLAVLKNSMENGDIPEDTNYRKIIDKCKKHNITKREIEILFKVLAGFEYKQIAADFNISINTVDKHIQQLHKKFHVQSNIELILLLK